MAATPPVRRGLAWIVGLLVVAIPLAVAFAVALRPALPDMVRADLAQGLFTARQLWIDAFRTPAAPYPPSPVIGGIEFDWSTRQRRAPGSGDWSVTWADDDRQYAVWNDGGGFGGSDVVGRPPLGIARIEGAKDDYRGSNVWGGANAENPVEFAGRAYSLLSMDGELFTWSCAAGDQPSATDVVELYRSRNHGATWRNTGVKFARASFHEDDGFLCPIFLQFGRDYDGARDDHVYVYAPEVRNSGNLDVQIPGAVTLMRVPRAKLVVRSAFEFFAGLDQDGAPVWTFDLDARRPVLQDVDNGVSQQLAAVYNPGLDRYILTVEHTRHGEGNLAIFDAPEPWGPWTTAHITHAFGRTGMTDSTSMWVFPSKWLSDDGRNFVMLYSGEGANESWNTVEGRFVPAAPDD